MKKYINRLVYIPFLFIFLAIFIFGLIYSKYIEDVTKEEFKKIALSTEKNEKKILKINLDSIVSGVNEIKIVSFVTTENILSKLLDVVFKNYLNAKDKEKFFKTHFSDKLFFYIISRDFVYPSFYQTFLKLRKKHLITIYQGKKYLSVEKKFNDKIIGIAFDLSILDEIIKKEIIDYIASLNHGKDYIAFSKITNWDAPNGVFGKMVYHPLKEYIGMELNFNKPDIKGNYFRKKYFECLKEKDGCFVKYYFKNPETGKYEKKLSYFRIYRPYDFVFVKGVYYSDIIKEINCLKEKILDKFYHLMINTLFFILFFMLISLILAKFISDKIKNEMVKQCDLLRDNYISSKKELFERIYYDKLTGLPSKVKLTEDLKKFKSLIIVDLDEFANINNLYGFEFGDEILKCIANYLKQNYSNVYRVGSDEFAILMDKEITEKDLKKLSNTVVNCFDVEISFIIGASNVKDLFLTAESALKMANRLKIRYLLYEEELKEKQKERLNRLKKLRKALKNRDLIPYYQGIVDRDKKILKYEALMRIKIDNEILTPFLFMDLIKDAKMYEEFSKMMIEKVFEDVKKKKVNVSINLSFKDIVNIEINKFILDNLKKWKIGKYITFEILESESIGNMEMVKKFITAVKKYDVKIAIDDFGSGYSNLVNLLSLSPDYIKIDGSLIKNMDKQEYFEIVKLIAEFAMKFNISTIAEFVENENEFNMLKEIGIECFQGYYFHKPQPFDKIS